MTSRAQHFGRRALRQQPPDLQHKNMRAKATNQFHVVLDDHDAAIEGISGIGDEAVDLRPLSPLEPGGGLVEQQELRLGRQGTISSPSIFCRP